MLFGWNKVIKKSTKKSLYDSFVKSDTIYEAEVWDPNVKYE